MTDSNHYTWRNRGDALPGHEDWRPDGRERSLHLANIGLLLIALIVIGLVLIAIF